MLKLFGFAQLTIKRQTAWALVQDSNFWILKQYQWSTDGRKMANAHLGVLSQQIL